MNLKKGDICFIISENFGGTCQGYHYEIVKGIIKNVPRGNLHEYDIICNGNMYVRKRKGIYTDYDAVLPVIDKMADDYDKRWERIMGTKMERPWKKGEG